MPGSVAVREAGDELEIRFDGVLQAANAASGPYRDEPGAVSPWRVKPAGQARFFRSRE